MELVDLGEALVYTRKHRRNAISNLPALPAVIDFEIIAAVYIYGHHLALIKKKERIPWYLNEAEQVHRKNSLGRCFNPQPNSGAASVSRTYLGRYGCECASQLLPFTKSYTQSSMDYAECTEYPSRTPYSGGLHVKVQVLMPPLAWKRLPLPFSAES